MTTREAEQINVLAPCGIAQFTKSPPVKKENNLW